MQFKNESNSFQRNYSIQLNGLLMDLSTVKIMGVVNPTPDSFFKNSRFNSEKEILFQVEKMVEEGVDILDIGAFSSKPNSQMISEQEERERLLPFLKSIVKHFPQLPLSVDTYRSEIAKEAVHSGAAMINDISAGNFDPKMIETMGELKIPYVMMHMQGEPSTMQNNPSYEDVFREVFAFFSKKLSLLNEFNVNDVILDVGFGFGKNISHNYQLLKKLAHFHTLECPLLIGLSRKGMIQKVIEQTADEALNGTTVAHTIALLNGASILRVHDVKEAKEAVDIVEYYEKQ